MKCLLVMLALVAVACTSGAPTMEAADHLVDTRAGDDGADSAAASDPVASDPATDERARDPGLEEPAPHLDEGGGGDRLELDVAADVPAPDPTADDVALADSSGCQSGLESCDDDNLTQCIDGAWHVVEPPCEFGCTKGRCNACRPAVTRCIGKHGDHMEVCEASGGSWAFLKDCSYGCIDVACVDCVDGTWRTYADPEPLFAYDAFHLLRCDAGKWTFVDHADFPADCVDADDSIRMRIHGDYYSTDCTSCSPPVHAGYVPDGCVP